MDQADAANTLRDALETNLDAAEAGTLAAPADSMPIESPADTADQTGDRVRDDKGRFASKETTPDQQAAPAAAEPQVQAEPQEELKRPTSWKKDYLPIWDKMATGQPLTPEEARKIAQYSHQREKEFASGVSTYKAEADNAKTLQEALAPFIPDLQANNIHPAAWISNLGRAHQMLAKGTVQDRIQMFAQLAQEYNVPLAAFSQQPNGQGGIDPVVGQLMQQLQDLSGKVNTVASWREQQEQQQLQGVLSPFFDEEKYPHFQKVRMTMAQLLESGVTQDLESAYKKAVRLDDDAWAAEQERVARANAAHDAVAKAKAKAVSVKTTTPSGTIKTMDAKDRRSVMADAFESASEGRV